MEDRHGKHLTHFTFKNTIKRKTAKEKKGRGRKTVKTHFLTVLFCHSDNVLVKRTVLTK